MFNLFFGSNLPSGLARGFMRLAHIPHSSFYAGLAVAVMVGGMSISPGDAAPLFVSDIRLGLHPDSTRVVLDVSGEARPEIFEMTDPYRIVIDLPTVEFDMISDKTNASAGVIETIRYGLFRPGTSRVVLDLKGPARVAGHFALPAEDGLPWRLVIDLESTDREKFLAAVSSRDRAASPEVADSAILPDARPDAGPIIRPLRSRPVIVIDAGHGGVDPGATSYAGTHEKDIVLAFARILRDRLTASGRYDVVMTRDRDIFLPLRDRVRAAQQAQGDLFVSLHTNSHPDSDTRGFSVYTLSERASDEQTEELAQQENKADIIGGLDLDVYGDDVAGILIDFARTRTNELSVAFARDAVVTEFSRDVTMLNRPWRSAGFAVLKAPDVPSVLLELGYLTNRAEARLLMDRSYRDQIAESFFRSIDRFFESEQSASRN